MLKVAAHNYNTVAPTLMAGSDTCQPGDKKFLTGQWYLHAEGDRQTKKGADINIADAWKITKGNRRIVIAILDTSFDLTHPAFCKPHKIVSPRDYVNRTHPFAADGQTFVHGNMCAGLALAEDYDGGMLGVAPDCSFMPVRIPLQPGNQLMIPMLEETASIANVIACCWSAVPGYSPLSDSVYNCIKKIATTGGPEKNGCVICFAAGNHNAPINDAGNIAFEWLDEAIDQWRMTRGPILNGFATHPDVITVAASTSLNRKAVYSNWGREISVCAPSNNYHPVSRQVFVEGRGGVRTTNRNSGKPLQLYTNHFGGTSASTAIVAGVAGLILSADPGLCAAEVKKIMIQTTDKIIDKHSDDESGTGRGYYINGHAEWFGYGKINAGKALRIVSSRPFTHSRNIVPDHNYITS